MNFIQILTIDKYLRRSCHFFIILRFNKISFFFIDMRMSLMSAVPFNQTVFHFDIKFHVPNFINEKLPGYFN